MQESVPSILEADARGEVAEIYADIRKVLGTSVVNLIWRNLATMPGALPWTWATVRPLSISVRRRCMPKRSDAPSHCRICPAFPANTLLAAGIDKSNGPSSATCWTATSTPTRWR